MGGSGGNEKPIPEATGMPCPPFPSVPSAAAAFRARKGAMTGSKT